MNAAWPIEEVLLRPILTLLLAALVPFATVRALRFLALPKLPKDPESAARTLAPFRQGAFIVGLVQIQLSWAMGITALGPALVSSPDAPLSIAFAAVCAITTFLAGGVARLVEGPTQPGTARAQVLLRLRMIPWFAGPVLASSACAALPMIALEADGPTLRPGMVLLSFVGTALGVAFGGPLLSVITTALRPATPEVRAIAARVAKREGVRLLAVLRLPTHGARFANAAALPWARTMVVTDYIVELLSEAELEAVLAHEAGHLSEGPWVVLGRLGTVIVLLFTLSTGVRLAEIVSPGLAPAMLGIGVLIAVPILFAVRNLARRMEERADAHARENVSAEALGSALLKLHVDARMPLVTGRKRVHPDLYDRLVACGREMGPRPEPPPRWTGLLSGLLVSVALVALPILAEVLTPIAEADVPAATIDAARRRLRVDPWDANAMLATAWASRRDEDLERAEARAAEAMRLGASRADLMELEAELLAARHRCDEARARFEAALEQRARERFEAGMWEPLELGGYTLPPTLVRACGYGYVEGEPETEPEDDEAPTRP
jgi:Zn-dependent protease with chaperone function